MPRRSTIQLAALNIVTHPHSTQLYADLFRDAFKINRKPIKLRGDQYGLVRSVFEIVEGKPELGLEGEIIRFMQIGADEPWFNLETTEQASDQDLKQIHIPDHLRPKMKSIRYVFLPKEHRLVFVASAGRNTISPTMAQQLFRDSLNHPKLRDQQHPEAIVTVEQSHEALSEIFSIPFLKELRIQFHKPNHDEGDLTEKAIYEELDEQNIGSVLTDYKADHGESLKPNKRTKLLADLAKSNGHVEGKGKDADGKKVEIDTIDHPRIEPHRERLDALNIILWLRDKAAELARKLARPNE